MTICITAIFFPEWKQTIFNFQTVDHLLVTSFFTVLLAGGGRDGRIVKYDAELKSPVGVEAVVPEHLGAVRVISQGNKLILIKN